MSHKPDLVLSGSHEMRRERGLRHAVENARVDLARNVSRPQLLFDPAIQLENELMRVAHLL
jgi:hypothetical protein